MSSVVSVLKGKSKIKRCTNNSKSCDFFNNLTDLDDYHTQRANGRIKKKKRSSSTSLEDLISNELKTKHLKESK